MEPVQHGIDYLEFQVRDMALTKAFYASAFAWRYTDYGPAYCEFDSGSLKGGFELVEAGAALRTGGALVVLWSGDLEASLTAVQEAISQHGGRLTREIFSFPGGRRFQFCDPNEHELAVWSQS